MSKVPKPGEPVRGSKSGVPVMALFDLLGRNWSLGILWHLRSVARNFRELQADCQGISPTTLNTRLGELRKVGIIEKTKEGYKLTNTGIKLVELLLPLNDFAKKWASKM